MKANYKNKSKSYIMKKLKNKTWSYIRSKAVELKIGRKNKKLWDKSEKDFLFKNYEYFTQTKFEKF